MWPSWPRTLGVDASGGIGSDGLGQPGRGAERFRSEADRQALEHQHGQRRAPAVADTADDGVLVEPDVVEEHLVELRLAGDLAQAPDGDARRRPSGR